MKKYLTVFKISLSNILTHRVDLAMWRLRSILVLVMLFFLWSALTKSSGRFAGYSAAEILTYVLWVNFLQSAVFGVRSREMVKEINSGIFSKYLAMPVSYFWYQFAREGAERLVNIILALIETALFIFLLKPGIIWQTNPHWLAVCGLSSVLAVFIYYALGFMVSAVAFWSREAMGPRFLFDWLLEFSAGTYFPLSILPKSVFVALHFLPFLYLVFLPIEIYLGRVRPDLLWPLLAAQALWLLVAVTLLHSIWRKALEKYTGEGI